MIKNILCAVPAMDAGGVEVGILELAKKINETKDFNLFILTSGGKLLSQINYANVKVINLDIKSKNPFVMWKNQSKIKQILIENKINIVQAESRIPAWNLYFVCKKLNIPFITVVHGIFGLGSSLGGYFKKMYNSIILKGQIVIPVSNFMRNYCLTNYQKYLQNQENKIQVVYRGIDTDYFNPINVSEKSIIELKQELNIPSDKKIIICPARMTYQKAQDYLLKALNLIKDKNFVCYLIGNNDKHIAYKNEILQFIKDNNLQNSIKICDNINNMPTLYYLSDLVILSSRLPESFGRISIEAQAMKKIFIGTAIGGTLETVINNETGFLAPINDEQGFANIIEKALNLSDAEKTKIVENARQNVLNNYTIDSFYNKMKNIYFSIDKNEY